MGVMEAKLTSRRWGLIWMKSRRMRYKVLLLELILTCTIACESTDNTVPRINVPAEKVDGAVTRFQRWGKQVLAKTGEHFRVVSDTPTAVFKKIPGLDKIVDLAGAGKDAFAFGLKDGKPALVRWSESGTIPHSLPAEVGLGRYRLFTNGNNLVLISATIIHHFHDNKWSSKKQPSSGEYLAHGVLLGKTLFAGFNVGIVQGKFRILNLATSFVFWKWLGPPDDGPITGLVLGPSGRIWISTGLFHKGFMLAGIYYYEKGKLIEVLNQRHYDERKTVFPDDSYIAGISFSPKGTLHVLTNYGGFRLIGDKFVPIFLFSRRIETVISLHVGANGRFFVGTRDRGVLVIDADGPKGLITTLTF